MPCGFCTPLRRSILPTGPSPPADPRGPHPSTDWRPARAWTPPSRREQAHWRPVSTMVHSHSEWTTQRGPVTGAFDVGPALLRVARGASSTPSGPICTVVSSAGWRGRPRIIMKKFVVGAALVAATIGIGGTAFAGEVTGRGNPTQGPAHANSI